ARLAPIRFWIKAEPFRSTQSSSTVRWRTMSTTASAFTAAITSSTSAALTPPPSARFDARFRSFPRQPLDQVERALAVEVLVVVVVPLHHRRGAARCQTLDLVERELAVGRGAAEPDAEALLDRLHDVVGAPQHARHVGADLQVVLPDRLLVIHRVE